MIYSVQIRHDGLQRSTTVTAAAPHWLHVKRAAQLARWDEIWAQRQADALRRQQLRLDIANPQQRESAALAATADARQALDQLASILDDGLARGASIPWESYQNRVPVPTARPAPPDPPAPADLSSRPREPRESDPAYQPPVTLFDRILPGRRQKKCQIAAARFRSDHDQWQARIRLVEEQAELARARYAAAQASWETSGPELIRRWEGERAAFDAHQREVNAGIEQARREFETGDPGALGDALELVLMASKYPHTFPQAFQLSYEKSTRAVHVDYTLPAAADLPRLKEIAYVQARRKCQEVFLSQRAFDELYDGVLYQVALRTLSEIFATDQTSQIDFVQINGLVANPEPDAHRAARQCLLTLAVDREDFEAIRLTSETARTDFRDLGGVTAGPPHLIQSVEPLPPPPAAAPQVAPLPVDEGSYRVDLSSLGD